MPATLPVPIEFRIPGPRVPGGRLAVRPETGEGV